MTSKVCIFIEWLVLFLLILSALTGVVVTLITGNYIWLGLTTISLIFAPPIFVQVIESWLGEEVFSRWHKKVIQSIPLVFAAILILLGIGTFIHQVYIFLRLGNWDSLSLIDGMVFLKMKWALKPEDWIGLWGVLDKTPLSVVFILWGFYLFNLHATRKNDLR